MTLRAIALAGTLLSSMGAATAESPSLAVGVRAVPETRATVDLEIRNASEDAIDGLVYITLWLTDAVEQQGCRVRGYDPGHSQRGPSATSSKPAEP